MKKTIFMTALLALVSVMAFGQAGEGVKFEKGTLKEALAKAGKENKLVFVDVYAVWCGPCQYMAGKVFPQKAVGDYFNANFVNIKFDAEKGEGIDIARQYGVTGYPTFLLLNDEGYELGRIVGGGTADQFIAKVKEKVAEIEKN